jgi:P pilus assembly chaperone PapD
VKATPVDLVNAAVGLAYDRMSAIEKRQTALRWQRHNGKPINADNPTPEYKRLADQLSVLEEVVYQARDLQHYAILPTSGGPRKVRRRQTLDWASAGAASASDLDWSTGGGSSSGDFSWDQGVP